MKIFHKIPLIIIGTSTFIVLQATEIRAVEVSQVAKDITVHIVGTGHGSGSIIKHQKGIYTVLTAAHVVPTGKSFSLITPDNKAYTVDNSTVKRFPGVDLAILKFKSSQTYSVVALGNSNQISRGDRCYVAGFPLRPGETEAKYRFVSGFLSAKASKPLADGYALGYLNETIQGMSGGPLLDQQGKLVGVHGRSLSPYRSNKGFMPEYGGSQSGIKIGVNLSIPINIFLNMVPKVDPTFGLKSTKSDVESKAMTADDYFMRAVDSATQKDYAAMMSNFDSSQNQSVDKAYESYEKWKKNRDDKDVLTNALSDLDQTIQLAPDHVAAYLVRGFIYQDLDNYKQAFEDYNQSIRLNSEIPVAYFLRGSIRFHLGLKQKDYQSNAALDDYNQWIRLDPTSAYAYYFRSIYQLTVPNHQAALKDINQAIDLSPNNADFYFRRSMIRYLNDDRQGAIEDKKQALSLNPDLAKSDFGGFLTNGSEGGFMNFPNSSDDVSGFFKKGFKKLKGIFGF